jgi:hypothetical protein
MSSAFFAKKFLVTKPPSYRWREIGFRGVGLTRPWRHAPVEWRASAPGYQSTLGDLTAVANVNAYPPQSVKSATRVYQSLSLAQVRWDHPDLNRTDIRTEPLRWRSTAFAADHYGRTVRLVGVRIRSQRTQKTQNVLLLLRS